MLLEEGRATSEWVVMYPHPKIVLFPALLHLTTTDCFFIQPNCFLNPLYPSRGGKKRKEKKTLLRTTIKVFWKDAKDSEFWMLQKQKQGVITIPASVLMIFHTNDEKGRDVSQPLSFSILCGLSPGVNRILLYGAPIEALLLASAGSQSRIEAHRPTERPTKLHSFDGHGKPWKC